MSGGAFRLSHGYAEGWNAATWEEIYAHYART